VKFDTPQNCQFVCSDSHFWASILSNNWKSAMPNTRDRDWILTKYSGMTEKVRNFENRKALNVRPLSLWKERSQLRYICRTPDQIVLGNVGEPSPFVYSHGITAHRSTRGQLAWLHFSPSFYHIGVDRGDISYVAKNREILWIPPLLLTQRSLPEVKRVWKKNECKLLRCII